MLKTKLKIEYWLKQHCIENYTINDDLTVDIKGSASFSSQELKEFPVQFGIVEGNFNCSGNFLKSLKGSPSIVHGSFYCDYNNLTSLEYCPKIVKGNFICSYNPIESIKDLELEVGSHFYHANSSKIKELAPYYENKINKIIEVRLSMKEIKSILSYQDLSETVTSQSDRITKKIKV